MTPESSVIKDLLVEKKSSKGLPIYGDSYLFLESYLLDKVSKFNSKLREEYEVKNIKTSSLLDYEEPLVKYYCDKFPEKLFTVNKEDQKYVLKPACCCNAFKLWSNNKRLRYNQVYHEVADVYRVESLGGIRTLERNCYFNMADYHAVIDSKNLESLRSHFINIRNLIYGFYLDLLGPKTNQIFTEAYRINQKEGQYYLPEKYLFDAEPIIEKNYTQGETPYWTVKQEFIYNSPSGHKLQLGTVQLDNYNPKVFNFEGTVLHFSMGSTPRLIELLVSENLLPIKGLKVVFKGNLEDNKEAFMRDWDLEGSLLIENKKLNLSDSLSLKSLQEQIFWPLVIIYGDLERKDKKFTLVDRVNKVEKKLTKEELKAYPLIVDRMIKTKEIYYTKTYNLKS